MTRKTDDSSGLGVLGNWPSRPMDYALDRGAIAYSAAILEMLWGRLCKLQVLSGKIAWHCAEMRDGPKRNVRLAAREKLVWIETKRYQLRCCVSVSVEPHPLVDTQYFRAERTLPGWYVAVCCMANSE